MKSRKSLNRIYMGSVSKNKATFSFSTGNFKEAVRDFFSRLGGSWKGILGVLILLLLVGRLWFYVAIIRELPDFDKIKDGFSQTTNIVDRDGKTLYKVYDQNRQYVPLSGISENLVHAIVAAEDKDFWTNQGVDFRGLLRAGLSAIVNRNLKGPGGSTITQQLIKNILLTTDKKLTRKIKEIYLATRIDDYIRGEVRKENSNLSSKELDKATKSKILELYMNYIFLGNNAYGVEAASNTYFGKKAQDLDVLEASIIGSMPQSPSTLNPYRNADRLMGSLTITSSDTPDAIVSTGVQDAAKNQFIDAIKNSDRSIARSSDGISSWMSARGSFKITVDGKDYKVEYTPGRKDYVLSRMYEDGYIDVAQVKEALVEAQNYQFKSLRVDITAPHFVFWVQEFLKSAGCEQKILPRCFTDEELAKGGLTIKTTLDGDAQMEAEKSITDNMATINGYGANNSSLIYVDSRDGDVLAYVGSADYNNEEIDGNVDMVQQPRQPGSSIKPLIYSYGFMNLPLTIDTTIYDLKFAVGKDTPNNNDGAFLGPMPLKKALGYSRNIPAIKMYFAVGGQDKLVPFLNDVGIASYDTKKDYGYPMAIGSAELKMIELTNAYMHLSAMGRPAKINPILEIRGPDGQILYQKQPEQQAQIIPEGVAYLIWKILADTANLPAAWVNNFFVRGLTYANKSGTTDMIDVKTGKKYPRDGWLVGYTPSKVALFWAGNTQGKPMNLNAYGGWVNGKTFRQFFSALVKKGKIQTEDVSPIEVKNVTISKVSGKLASDTTPENYKVSTMGYINTLPSQADSSFSPIQVDKACMGKVTDATPRYDIISTYLITPSTFMPNNMDLNDITNWFTSKLNGSGSIVDTGDAGSDQISYANLLVKAPTDICQNRTLLTEDSTIQLTIRKPGASASIVSPSNIWYDVTSPNPITSIRILLDDVNIGEYTYTPRQNLSDIKTITLPAGTSGIHSLSVIAINQDGGFSKKTVQITVVTQDNTPPMLLDDKVSVTKKGDNQYSLVMLFVDNEGAVKGGKISMTNGTLLKKFDGNIASLDIQIPQVLNYEVTDMAGNTKKGSVDVAQYVK